MSTNRSDYNSALTKQAPKKRGRPSETATDAHVDQIIRSTRALLIAGGTVEDGLNAILEGSRRELACRIVFRTNAIMRIDGHDYEWGGDERDHEQYGKV